MAAVALMTTLDVVRQRNAFDREVEERGELLSRTLNDVLGNALYFRDVERLRHLVDAVRANPAILEFRVFAPDGRILVDPGGLKYPEGRVEPEKSFTIEASSSWRLILSMMYASSIGAGA